MRAPNDGTFTERKTVVVAGTHSNIDQEIIEITSDKLELVLHKRISKVEHRRSWIAPLGILITIGVTFATSEFHKFIFEASTWKAIFLMAGFLVFGWFCWAAWQARQAGTVEDLLGQIKKRDKDT